MHGSANPTFALRIWVQKIKSFSVCGILIFPNLIPGDVWTCCMTDQCSDVYRCRFRPNGRSCSRALSIGHSTPDVGSNLLQKMGAGVCSSFATEVEVAGCFCQMGSSAEEAIQPLSSENLLRENGVGLNQEEGKWGSTQQSTVQHFPKRSCKQKVDFLEYYAGDLHLPNFE